MIFEELTEPAQLAKQAAMDFGETFWRRGLLVLPMLSAVALAGCITVKAPDKPIVIELNINIKQEVVYRLSKDAGTTIDDNPGIF